MQKTPTKNHRAVVFIGLAAAIALCALSGIANKRVRPPRTRASIEELDARAKHHFDEVERNVPSVIADLTADGNSLKLCWLMVGDKISGTDKTLKFIESKIHSRIVVPCQRGAEVYGCKVDSDAIRNELLASGRDSAMTTARLRLKHTSFAERSARCVFLCWRWPSGLPDGSKIAPPRPLCAVKSRNLLKIRAGLSGNFP